MTDHQMIEQESHQLALSNIINWIPVERSNPPKGENGVYFTIDQDGFMYERHWKGHFWEGSEITTHWTIIKTP